MTAKRNRSGTKRSGLGAKRSNTSEGISGMNGNLCAKIRYTSHRKEITLKKKSLSPKGAHKSYECEACFVTFSKRYNLNRHLDHYGDPKHRPYTCVECGTKFSNAKNLRSHVTFTHEVIVSKMFKIKCPVCNQRTNLEENLRRHLCHCHSGWENTNLNIFVTESCRDKTKSLSANNNSKSSRSVVTKRSRKARMIRLIKCLAMTTSNDNKVTNLIDEKKNTKSESLKKTFKKSDSSIDDKNVQPYVEIYRIPNEIEALFSNTFNVGVRVEETKKKSINDLQNCEKYKDVRNTRSTTSNSQNRLRDGNKSVSNRVAEAFNGIGKNPWPRLSSMLGLIAASEKYQDAALRTLYSCKDCCVPLVRINATKKTPSEVVTRKNVTEGSTKEECIKISLEKSTCPADDSTIFREIGGPVKQNKRSEQQVREKKKNQFKLIDVEVHLEKLSHSDVFSKSKTENHGNHEPSSVSAASEEGSDPPSSSRTSQVDNCDVDEPSKETSDTFAESPVSSSDTGLKTEVVNCDADEISEVRTGRAQCHESLTFSFEAEPMNYQVDGHSTVRANEKSFAECPELPKFPIKSEIVNYEFGEPSNQLTDTSVECTNTFDTMCKVDIDDHTIYECSDYKMKDSEESGAILNPNAARCDTSTLSESGQKVHVQQSRTLISSRICNNLFTSRRSMLRHCRDRHLTCFNDTIYCTCGKEMIGRRALENHFSRHCDKVVETTSLASHTCSPCEPLEKKYVCSKCGEKFWLETCLNDHPPHCESPKPPKPVKQNRVTNNLHETYGIMNYQVDNGQYICLVCDVKFTSVDTLVRHVRTFSTNERHPCPICRTAFTGVRLLRGHVQATHELSSTTSYTFFCDICNQGFTKRIYKRIHMMHIHSNEARASAVGNTENHHSDGFAPPTVMKTPDNQCDVCNLVFVNRKRFMDHVDYYKRSELFHCNICGEGFVGQFRAHHHRKTIHCGGKVPNSYAHYCAICKEGFMYKTHLHAHMFHVHDEEFNCVTSVKNHTRAEQNKKSPDGEFACNRCPKKFQTDSILLAHLYSYHSDSGMPGRVKCSRCDEEFSTWSGWIFHLKHSHIIDPNNPLGFRFTDNNKSFNDSGNNLISGGMFGGPRNLNSGRTPQPRGPGHNDPRISTSGNILPGREILHSLLNGGKSQTKCTICGFDFPGTGGLARHRAMFLNSGIYVCEFCGRRFSWQTFYRDHKLKHFRRDVHNNCFCPVCDEGFETIQSLEMHTVHLHQQSLDRVQLGSSQNLSRKLLQPISETSAESGDKAIDSTETCDSRMPRAEIHGNAELLHNCPNCEEKYVTFEQLEKHLTSMHKDNRFDKSDTPKDIFNSLNDYATCSICNMVFISKEMLKIHRENCHSLHEENDSTTRGTECFANGQANQTGDRFYVSLGDNINSSTVNTIGSRIHECNQAVGLTNNLYRYDASLKCDICDLTFASTDMLSVHHEILHKIRINFNSGGDNVYQEHPSQITTVEISPDIPQLHECTEVHSHSSHNPLLQSKAETPQTMDEVSTKIVGNIPNMSEATYHNQFNYYQCRVCDIIFIDENLLTVHEENVHRLKTPDGNSSSGGSHRSSNIVGESSQPDTEHSPLETDNGNLSITQLITQRGQSVSNIEPISAHRSPQQIFISDDEAESNSESSLTSMNPSSSANKGVCTSPHEMRFVNLPPGKYKIAKLKVRSVDTAIGKSMRNINGTESTMKF